MPTETVLQPSWLALIALTALLTLPAAADDSGARIATQGTPGGTVACATCHGHAGHYDYYGKRSGTDGRPLGDGAIGR